MSGVRNGDGTQPAESFPGIENPVTTGAAGSTASRTPPPDRAVPDFDTGAPGLGSPQPVSVQAVDGRGASTTQPGQVDGSVISPGTPGDYGDSGAGAGRTFADARRYPWQSRPGRNG